MLSSCREPDAAAPAADLRYGDFDPISVAGYGASGAVITAFHRPSRHTLAIKAFPKLHPWRRRAAASEARFHVEKEILSVVSGTHPFLPSFYSSFESAEYSFLAMDYCPGSDLQSLRQKQPDKIFSHSVIRFYAAEIVLALEHLHSLGIVYRDLKPENVLISDSGHVVLTDFDLCLKLDDAENHHASFRNHHSSSSGLSASHYRHRDFAGPDERNNSAKQQQQLLNLKQSFSGYSGSTAMNNSQQRRRRRNASPLQLISMLCVGSSLRSVRVVAPGDDTTSESVSEKEGGASLDEVSGAKAGGDAIFETAAVVGTEEYIAPEVIRGEGYGFGVDWWALGVLLFEMMYGRTPFRGRGRGATFYNILHLHHPALLQTRPAEEEDGGALNDLISRLLVKDPERRFRTAQDVKQHPFFFGTDWGHLPLLVVSAPPFIPPPPSSPPQPPSPLGLHTFLRSLDNPCAAADDSSSSSGSLSVSQEFLMHALIHS